VTGHSVYDFLQFKCTKIYFTNHKKSKRIKLILIFNNYISGLLLHFCNIPNGVLILTLKVKVKQSHYMPGVAQRVLRKLRFPDFVTMAQDGGKVVSLTHRPPLPP